jgi:hypothetical protein
MEADDEAEAGEVPVEGCRRGGVATEGAEDMCRSGELSDVWWVEADGKGPNEGIRMAGDEG